MSRTPGSVYVESEDILVNFDVTFIFTNVPVGETVSIIHERLRKDETLGNRTFLSQEQIAELLEMCLKSTDFSNSYGKKLSMSRRMV